MQYWKVKHKQISGTSYHEVYKKAHVFFKLIKQKSKRHTFVKSKYFKQKVLFDYFWKHLLQKRPPDRIRRLKLFICAIDVIENSNYPPQIYIDSKRKNEILYRFSGKSKDGQKFLIQIKGKKNGKNKQLISIFPISK